MKSTSEIEKAVNGQKWLIPVVKKVLQHMDTHGRSKEDAIEEAAPNLHEHDLTLLRIALEKLDVTAKFKNKVQAKYKVTSAKVSIENLDLGVDYADAGPWRSYELQTEGDSEEELIENAHIFEIDQDGGNLNDYKLSDAPSEVERAAEKVIKEKWKKEGEGK